MAAGEGKGACIPACTGQGCVYSSMHLAGGVSARGGVCPWGVSAQEVSAQGGCLLEGEAVWGVSAQGVSSQGVSAWRCLPARVPAQGGVCPGWCLPSAEAENHGKLRYIDI